MSEDFKGEIPEIEIRKQKDGDFSYWCKTAGFEYKPELYMACPKKGTFEPTEECYDCIGYNDKFARFYNKNKWCTNCNRKVDFGYFIIIYLLEKAGLLSKNFKIKCCMCKKHYK